MSRGTLDPALLLSVSPTGLSPSLAGLSRTVPLQSEVINAVRTPECTHSGLGSFHFARRYFENRVFFLFLRLLRCFSSPGSLRTPMDSVHGDWGMLSRVSPFRNLRINGYVLLPVAYRSLSRLSSALSAKASTLRSFLLDLVYSFYSVRNWVFAFNNADRIASILNFRSFGLVVNFVYDILGCLDKKSFSSKSSVWSFQGTIANFVRIRNCFAISATSAFFNAFVTVWLNVYQSLETSTYWNL